MKDKLSEEDRLFDEAVDLLIRLQGDQNNPLSIEMARSWRARGPAYEDAWIEACEIHGMTGKILTDQRKAARRSGYPSRRTFMVGATVAAGGALAGSYVVPRAILRAKADYITTTGEIRHERIPDGSAVTLGPDSALALHLTDTVRRIELLQGMAFFEVAPDPARPFEVRSGEALATALGTAFEVSDDTGFVTVAVAHGLVGVRLPSGVEQRDTQLSAGHSITFGEKNRSVVRATRDAAQISAWMSGQIVAEQERISVVVAQIGRWYPGRIIMADRALGNEYISGVFNLGDPLGALDAIVLPYGGKIHRFSSYLVVISRI